MAASVGSLIASTVLPENPTVFGNMRVAFAKLTIGTDYAAGGLTLVPADYGLSQIAFVAAGSGTAAAAAHNYTSWDAVANKLQVFVSSTGAELANGAGNAQIHAILVYGF